jgi:phosphohistidine phosphatase
LQITGSWKSLGQGQARLKQLLRGSSLPKKFPFPTAHGEELRDRPAYYYTQSSVIPYRVNQNGVEILIVRSSQDKHWVIPKGIAEPGLSLQDSAGKEALEEAGVEGRVLEEPIGSYSYAKWGATCAVTVYPMEVSRQLTEEEWEEAHRGRKWVRPEKAASMLRQAELAPLVVALEDRLSGA